ncbi:MAG: hypothetical protein ACK41T_01835 [Pseudobdellovibrio sp.]
MCAYPLKGSFQNSSQVIDFPDGRSLVVVGHAHGARQLIYSKYSLKIMDKSFAQISGPDLQQMLLQINAENSTTVFIYHPFIKSLSSSTTTVNTDALNR